MSDNPLDMMIGVESVKRDAQTAQQHAQKAKEAEEAGDRATALTEYRKAVDADPTNAEVMFRYAYLLDLCGADEDAIEIYERVCEFKPAPINSLMNLAVLYEDHGQFVKAERCLRQILETNPNHARAKLFMKDIQASREMVIEEDVDQRDVFKRKAMFDTPVTDFELSVRARTCLKKMNIRTLGDLLRITEAELISYKNFGDSSLTEIKRMLAARGLRLGQGLEDAHRAARRAIMEKLKGTGKEKILGKTVAELNLSVRARRALQLLNIQTVGDLASHTEAELMGIKNFGQTSLVEVREKLAEYGLSLRELDQD